MTWAILIYFGAVLLWFGCGVSYDIGKRAGRKAGDLAHVACHEAQQAIYEQARRVFLQAVSEHADIEAWEEEL